MKCNLRHPFFWLALLLALFWNHEAAAQNYLLRYVSTANGAVTFSGNTLGLNDASSSGSVGAFITTNTSLTAGGGYPNGTTLNWSNNSSAAVLRMPTNSTVLYAELIWAGTCETVSNAVPNSASNVLSYVTNTAVHFILPNGSSNNVAPDPATFSIVTNFNGTVQQALFYVRSANVTALVKAAGAGTYTVGGVPAEIFPGDNSDDCAGWTLAVAYQNSSLPLRNLSVFVGNYWINASSAANSPPVGIAGFITPPSGAINAYLFVSSMEGDPETAGDQLEVGVTTNSFSVLSGPNNLTNNFFCSQINYCQPDDLVGTAITNGYLDTSGSFGLSNSPAGSAVAYARQGWDITCVDASASLTNGFTSAYAKFITSGDGYSANALALQIAVEAPADVAIGKSGPGSVYAGTNFSYTITVTNLGPSVASNVVVTDSLPASVTFVNASGNGGTNDSGVVNWALGTLTSGQVSNLTVTVIAPASGSLTNTANVNSSTLDTNLVNNTSPPVDTTVTPVADLAIGKTGPANVYAGTNFSYTITVTNLGPSSASSVVVTDALPVGVTFVIASGNGANNSGVVTWALGTLTSGQVSNLTVTVTAPASGSFTNTAKVSSGTLDTNLLNNTSPPVDTAVTPLANLAIGKSGPAFIFATSNLTYTISVTNFGPSAASSVVVTDALPVGMTYVSASGNVTNSGGVVSWSLGTLAASALTNLTLTVTAPAHGLLTNTAVVNSPTGDPNPTNNTSPPVMTTVILVADVIVTEAGPANVFAGTNYSYTVTVTNSGPSTAGNVVVSDNLPTNTVFVSTTGGGTNDNGIVTWPVIPVLTNGGIFTFTVTVTAPATGPLTSTVSGVSGISFDPNPTNNNGSSPLAIVITTVTPVADLAVGKSGAAGSFLGANFGYTISVTNFGPSAATSLSVTDNLPAGLTYLSAVPNTVKVVGSQVVWTNLGSLAASAVTNLTLNVTTTLRGAITNFASTGSSALDTNTANNVSGPAITSVTNRPPVAINDSASTPENVAVTVHVLANDSDPDGDLLTIVFVNSTNGLAVISGTNVVFTPTNNFLGTTTVGYTISDGFGGTNSALITISVTNRPPVANPDSYAVTENTTNTFAVLTNDVVVTPGGSLTIISVSSTNGIATILNGTNIVFTPTNNFLGTTTIGYTIIDNVGGTNSSVVTVLVTNIPPLANPDFYVVPENSTNTFNPLTNDMVETPGGTLSIIGVSPTNGTATILNGTNIVFTPTNNFLGTATVGYTITDGIGGTNSSLITVTVTNIPPTAFGQSVTTTENTALPVTLTGNDPANLPLTFIIVSAPTNGTLTSINTNTGAVTYTPNSNYTGADAFTFRVSNGHNVSSNATVSIAVTPVADLLVQQSGPSGGVAGSNLVFTVAVTNLGPANATNVVVTNQIDPGFTFFSASSSGTPSGGFVIWTIPVLPANRGTNFTVTLFALQGGTFTNVASGGDVTSDLNPANNNGSLTNAQVITVVTPRADVAVFKTGDLNALAGGAVNYSITATNAGPSTASNVVVRDELPAGVKLQTVSGGGISNNGVVTWPSLTLTNGASTNFTVVLTAPVGGILTNMAFGTSDTPDPDSTNNNGSASNSIVITAVTPVADIAVGKSGAAGSFLGANFSYTISVTNFGPSPAANLSVTDNLPAGLTYSSALPNTVKVTGSQVVWTNLGSLAANAVTNLTLNVTTVSRGAVTNFASTGSSTLDTNTVNNVSAPVVTAVTNRPPVAVNDSASTPKNVAVTVPVLANDSDPDGDPLTIVSVSPTNGLAVISGTNVVFTPTNNFLGTATVGYTITDGFGGTNSALISILVTNRPPVATNQNVTTTENIPLAITLTGSDPDGDPLTFAIVSGPADGILGSLNTNTGVVTYTPGTNYNGPDSFTFIVNDGMTNSAFATVSITVGLPPPAADLRVLLSGPATNTVGDAFFYTTVVTNAGPQTATNTFVTNALPTNLVFVSASGGGVFSNGVVTWPVITSLTNGQATNLTVTVTPAAGASTILPTPNPLNFIESNSIVGTDLVTNNASAFAATHDPNLTNNIASSAYTNAQAQTLIVPGLFSILLETNTYPTNTVVTNTIIPIGPGVFKVGASAWNPVTQLYEEFLTVTNIGQWPVHALRLYVGGLRSGVTLYDATGTNGNGPYVEYDPPYASPLNPYPAANNSVTFVLELYSANSQPFTNSLTVMPILAPPTQTVSGIQVTNISINIIDARSSSERFLIQFPSIPGRTYTIEYSDDDMVTWNNAVPSIVASSTATLWYDNGPPETLSLPSSRFYRVILQP